MGLCFSSEKYDVFVSFRGEDTRNKFTDHLRTELEKGKVKLYIDENIKKGDEISPALTDTIKRAKVSVVVFSENYATSRWCLDELVQIMRLKKKKKQIVIPVFYGVDPSDVRKQKGSFEISKALVSAHGKKKKKAWKEALKKAANLSGFDSHTIRSEAKLVEEIVKDVKKKLDELRDKEVTFHSVPAAKIARPKQFQKRQSFREMYLDRIIATTCLWGCWSSYSEEKVHI